MSSLFGMGVDEDDDIEEGASGGSAGFDFGAVDLD